MILFAVGVVALIALVYAIVMRDQRNTIAERLEYSQKRETQLNEQLGNMGRYAVSTRCQAEHYKRALEMIVDLGTDKMANIGVRMSGEAAKAITIGEQMETERLQQRYERA